MSMSMPEAGDTLFTRPSPRGQVPTVALIAVFLGAYVVLGSVGAIPGWLMWAGVVVFGTVLAIGLGGMVRARASSWELRLDRAGVTVAPRGCRCGGTAPGCCSCRTRSMSPSTTSTPR